MTVPLRHFLVGLGFLIAGVILGIALVLGVVPGFATLVHVHLLLVGWVGVTIMGAMTQFVPVWSGLSLHSHRLATLQLVLVTGGLLGFVLSLLTVSTGWTAIAGSVMLAGFWLFAYNIARTLATLDAFDVTERHFVIALLFFLALTTFGVFLAVDLHRGILPQLGISHAALLAAHATLAVFGAVLTTIYGALYQLGTMFTQTSLHGIDHRFQRIEVVAHPTGVVLLAGGRLFELVPIARLGGLLILLAALVFGLIIGRKLLEMQVSWTPMHTRYGIVTVALFAWVVSATPPWVRAPTDPAHLFGGTGSVHLLLVGVIGFVILGTLYHIVPFIVWVRRYSDRLGYEPVPMIDELYDDRLAGIDGTTMVVGTAFLVASDWFPGKPLLVVVGGFLMAIGVFVFAANILLVLWRHSPDPIDRIVLGSVSPRPDEPSDTRGIEDDPT